MRPAPPRHRRERGGATLLLVMVLILFAALLGAVAVRGASSELQMAGSQRVGRTGFYCAEAGLAHARNWFAANFSQWNTIFNGGVVAGYPFRGDLDGDGANDYEVTLRDNVDEFPTNDPTRDNDLNAILISTCINQQLAGTSPRVLEQIIQFTGSPGTDYRFQAGHSSTHSGNTN